MSYINDALRKVQKEKESRYAAYENIVSAPAKKLDRSKKWLPIIVILAVFFFTAGLVVFLYGHDDKKVPAQKISAPAAASNVVTGHKPDNNTEIALQPRETTAQVVTKQEIGQSGGAPTGRSRRLPEITRPPASYGAVLPQLVPEDSKSRGIETNKNIAESKALFAQAMERQREGKLKEAKILYRKVIKIDKDNVQALNNIGVIYMSQKRYKRAIMRFKDAIKIKHNYPDAYYNLACLYAQKNDAARSLLYLKNAVEFNPEVIKWAKDDADLQVLADLPAFKKLLERP
jgi:tetratricopeptide (TPR) repeat protein